MRQAVAAAIRSTPHHRRGCGRLALVGVRLMFSSHPINGRCPVESAVAINPREHLDSLIRERGEDYASLSRLLGRNPAYIQQFIKRGTPKRLDEEDRRTLARYFGIAETVLGALDDARPKPLHKVPRLDVRASAGAGGVVVSEAPSDTFGFSEPWLRGIAGGSPSGLSMIKVQGDSMEPTLSDGDDILVNRNDGANQLRDGIYVLRMGDDLLVKRVARHPFRRTITIRSDNPAYPEFPNVALADLRIIGRVRWMGRCLS